MEILILVYGYSSESIHVHQMLSSPKILGWDISSIKYALFVFAQ